MRLARVISRHSFKRLMTLFRRERFPCSTAVLCGQLLVAGEGGGISQRPGTAPAISTLAVQAENNSTAAEVAGHFTFRAEHVTMKKRLYGTSILFAGRSRASGTQTPAVSGLALF